MGDKKQRQTKDEKRQAELIAEIQALGKELGRPPKQKEYPNAREAQDIWGSWTQVLQAAGCWSSTGSMTEQELLELYNKKKAELGRRPNAQEFNPYYQIIYRRYGSWYKWLEVIGDEKETSTNKLMESLRKFYEENGRSPEVDEIEHGVTIQKKIGQGSWLRALKKAGLPLTAEAMRREKNHASRELIRIIRRKAKELGRAPTAREVPESTTIIRRFGSWKNALLCADIKMRKRSYNRHSNITNKELLKEVQGLILRTEGRDPFYREFEHAGLCVKRFGKWSYTLNQAKADPYKTFDEVKKENQS